MTKELVTDRGEATAATRSEDFIKRLESLLDEFKTN